MLMVVTEPELLHNEVRREAESFKEKGNANHTRKDYNEACTMKDYNEDYKGQRYVS